MLDFRFAATAFATAFTIIDPVGMIPFSLAVTAGTSAQARAAIVDRAVIIAGAVIAVMGLVGRPLLEYLGITLPAFTIAGGILLFLIAIDMLFARRPGTKSTDAEEQEAAQIENPAVFPLAVPMIAGPGTIATVLLLISLTHDDRGRLAIVFVAFVAALFVTWLCMRAATLVLRVIGTTGVHVVTRLLGIILAALAVQFVLNGLVESTLFRHAPKRLSCANCRAVHPNLAAHSPLRPIGVGVVVEYRAPLAFHLAVRPNDCTQTLRTNSAANTAVAYIGGVPNRANAIGSRGNA